MVKWQIKMATTLLPAEQFRMEGRSPRAATGRAPEARLVEAEVTVRVPAGAATVPAEVAEVTVPAAEVAEVTVQVEVVAAPARGVEAAPAAGLARETATSRAARYAASAWIK